MDSTVAIIFMGFCIFGPMLISVYEKPQKVKYIYIQQTKAKQHKVNKQIIPKQIIPEINKNDSLKEDCLKCLRSLGMNKKDAMEKVEQMWKNKNYNSIEGFLVDAYRV